MIAYIRARLGWALVVLLGLTAVTFVLLYVLPSDPARAIAGGQASAQAVANIRHQLGLDQPVYIQYLRYLGGLLHGDLGYSYHSRISVDALLASRLPATLVLALSGIAASLVIGLLLGAAAALRQGGVVDKAVLALASLGVSTPPFWLGLLLLYIFAVNFQLLPIGGYVGPSSLVLPAMTLGLSGAAWYGRVFRTSMIRGLEADYTRVAMSKGLPFRTVVLWHVVPNAITPVLTLIGLDLAYYMGGVAVVEAVFGWPGIGQLAWQAIGTHDLPVILGAVFVSGVAVVLSNLAIDIAYAAVDPRIRYGSAS
jgi:peptide/nickel transport system permease protein